jgi:hypothetical protein
MKKMDERSIRCIASALRTCRDAFDNIADALEKMLEPSDEAEKCAPDITLEQVRAVLADKSRSGKTAKVRELLLSFGAEKLSEIDPARYAEMLKAAEAL